MFESIKNFIRYGSMKAKLIIASVVVIIIGALVIFVINALPKPEGTSLVRVDNFAETHVPDEYQTIISKAIQNILASNDESTSVSFSDGVIREDSYQEYSNETSTSAKFIIDFDSLHYSFQVNTSWMRNNISTDDPEIVISCPHYRDVIYTDKKCIASSPQAQLSRYLPHYEYITRAKVKLSVSERKYDSFQKNAGGSYLATELKACGNQSLKESAETAVVSWIKSIYLDPNDYKIEVIDTCR